MTADAHRPIVLTIRQAARRDLQVVLVDRLSVGRDCDGVLLADPQASRRHAEFRRRDGRVFVADLGSSNGTTHDGRGVSGEVEVGVGDVVRIGGTEITVGSPLSGIDPTERVRERPGSKTTVELLADEIAPAVLALELRSEGTFTIVFSDIENSTAYAASVGDERWLAILDRHNDIVRRELALAGGREVKSQGDGFMMSFDSARRAVDFAIGVQRALERARQQDPQWSINVRIGIHSGEAIATEDGDLFGRHVIIASRVADQAAGGEILASSLVRELAVGRHEFEFADGRVVSLKGIGDQVVHEINWR